MPVVGSILTALLGSIIPGPNGRPALCVVPDPFSLVPAEPGPAWLDEQSVSGTETESEEPKGPNNDASSSEWEIESNLAPAARDPPLEWCAPVARDPPPEWCIFMKKFDAYLVRDTGVSCVACNHELANLECAFLWNGYPFHRDCFMFKVTQEGKELDALLEVCDFHAGALPELQPPLNQVMLLLTEMTEDTQPLPGTFEETLPADETGSLETFPDTLPLP